MKGLVRHICNFIMILLVLGALYAFAMFQGGFVSWFLFFSFLPIFVYQLGLSLYPLHRWRVSRTLSPTIVQAGDQLSVTIHMRRKFPFPFYFIVVEDILPTTLNMIDDREKKYRHLHDPSKLEVKRTEKRIVFPWFRRKIDISYKLDHMPRGEHILQGVRVRTSDIFGFIKKEHLFQVRQTVVVHPNVRPIILSERISSFQHGGSLSERRLHVKNTNVAVGTREYVPGDQLSWIHWKQTAKQNEMMTKEFELEKNTDTLLVLDGCYYEGINPLAFEAIVELTLSLCESIHQQSSQVGLLTIGKEIIHFPLQHDQMNGQLIREHLTSLVPSKTNPFSILLEKEMSKMNSNAVVMLLTTEINDHLQDVILKMHQHSNRIIVFVVQSEQQLTHNDQQLMQQLTYYGISICLLTEKELTRHPIEVNI